MIMSLINQDAGQGLAEYALILLLVALGIITALGLVGEQINALFNTVQNKWP